MHFNDLILVSIDDHVIEPPDAFHKHMPAHLKSRSPFVEDVNGVDYWNIDGRRYMLAGLNAVAGRPREEYGIEPASYRELRPGSYDIKARIDDMNANGVLGSMCFPSIMGFGGGVAIDYASTEPEYALALVRAYNDWHVHEWAGSAPGRILPLGLLPMWDINAAVAEAKRLSGMGVHAVSIPDNPSYNGKLPSIHSPHWDPLWKVCAEKRIVLCLHIGTGVTPPFTSPEMPVDAWMSTIPMATSSPAADWLFSSVWRRFPDLRIALSEAGIGWIPYLLERADFIYDHHHAWTHSDFGKELPSDIFRRHFMCCFIDDKYGLKNRHEIGVDRILWECDYPHSDCTWPESPEILWEGLKDLPREEIDLITHLNAMREFNFDPLSLLGRDNCTVRALRQAGAHVNTAPTVGLGGSRPGSTAQVTVGDMQAQMAKQHQGMEA